MNDQPRRVIIEAELLSMIIEDAECYLSGEQLRLDSVGQRQKEKGLEQIRKARKILDNPDYGEGEDES